MISIRKRDIRFYGIAEAADKKVSYIIYAEPKQGDYIFRLTTKFEGWNGKLESEADDMVFSDEAYDKEIASSTAEYYKLSIGELNKLAI